MIYKTKIVIILLFVINFISQAGNASSPDEVQGGFKKCDVYEYEYKFGEAVNPRKVQSFLYNSDGNKIQEMKLYGITILKKINYKYNAQNLISEKVNITYHIDNSQNTISIDNLFFSDSPHKDIVKYIYDSSGNLIEEIFFDYDGTINKKISYEYTSFGKILKKVEYCSDGKICGKEIYKYDSTENEIERIFFDYDGTIEFRYETEYDSRGNEIDSRSYNNGDTLNMRFISKYNSSNNIIEQTRYYRQNHSITIRFKYDNEGNEIKNNHFDKEGDIFRENSFFYDPFGNLIEEISVYKPFRSFSRDTYKYDNFNNLIEHIHYNQLNEPSKKTVYVYSK